MSAADLLARLECVREVGPGRWTARCPAHEDRSPSLSIRELDDHRFLLHDFAGCSPADVMAAVGLELKDLFPERLDNHLLPVKDRRHFHAAREALKSLDKDSLLVAIAAENVARGIVLDESERQSLVDAAVRIRHAREVVT